MFNVYFDLNVFDRLEKRNQSGTFPLFSKIVIAPRPIRLNQSLSIEIKGTSSYICFLSK